MADRGLYFVDAQGDVTWNAPAASRNPLPTLTVRTEADLRLRNYRFPNLAWVPSPMTPQKGVGKSAVVPITVEQIPGESWSAALDALVFDDTTK